MKLTPHNLSLIRFLVNHNYFLYSGIFLILLSFMFFILLYTQVANVIIRGDVIKDLQGTQSFYKQSLLTLQESTIEKNIKKHNPWISTVAIEKKFPKTIIITIVKSDIVGYIDTTYSRILLSSEGTIVGKLEPFTNTSFANISYYQVLNGYELHVGDNIGFHDILTTLKALRILSDFGLEITFAKINAFNNIEISDGEKIIIFTAEKDIQIQVEIAKEILVQSKLQSTMVKKIDTRFQKPIVVY